MPLLLLKVLAETMSITLTLVHVSCTFQVQRFLRLLKQLQKQGQQGSRQKPSEAR